MAPNDIATIESALGFFLPKSYVDVVTNYPAELANTEAPDFGLFDDPTLIIDANRTVRTDGYCGEPWPDQYVIIGENGCGDYYVVTKNATQFSVGFADHEAMECNPFASNLDEFVAKLIVEQNGG
ncbi:SMI1/KNR4 family protein [Novipirellula caenicola]|uniref:Knr4/Smi1-like domain-containing protein n=1 Tax=Novipirellula caenicola TaxID=1536901 RepID=A0ABP9W1A4_9BACT